MSSTRNQAHLNTVTPMLYKVTFYGANGRDKPYFNIVARNIEEAIAKARENGLEQSEKHYEARWVETLNHVDLIAC